MEEKSRREMEVENTRREMEKDGTKVMERKEKIHGLHQAISRALAIFTDRKKGLAKAIKNHFPDCSHFFCVFHIKNNIIVKYGGLKETTIKCFGKRPRHHWLVILIFG